MKLSEHDLLALAVRASTLYERLGERSPLPDAPEPQADDRLLRQWCQAVAHGDWALFEKRLAWDGLDLNTARRKLCAAPFADPRSRPLWLTTFSEAMGAAAPLLQEIVEQPAGAQRRFLDAQRPLPFEELYLPFVDSAARTLAARAGNAYPFLSDAAHALLERNLLERLVYIGAQSLELEFSLFRTTQQPSIVRLMQTHAGRLATDQYRAFIGRMLNGGLLTFFQEYAVLARVLTTSTELWIDATAEFLARLASDWDAIQHMFGAGTELGQVVSVLPALSDLHNQGRSAIALTFASGLKLIYKPKDLGLDEAWCKLLAWLNQHGIPLPFKLVRALNRSTYGWVEFVDYQPCQDLDAARRYYQRAGMLLCLVYAWAGTDCHHENILACGEHPILLDLETLVSPQMRPDVAFEEETTEQALIDDLFLNSVLTTGMLPRWAFTSNGQGYDVSGLGSVIDKELPYKIPQWVHINTDGMALRQTTRKVAPYKNMPTLGSTYLSPNDYSDEIIVGFRHMYAFLIAHREALMAPDGPLAPFAQLRVRFIYRATKIYAVLLQKTLHPTFLREGVVRSIEFDRLCHALLGADVKHPRWPIIGMEQQALEQMDIPFFTTCSDSDSLEIADQVIEHCFIASSYDLVVQRLTQLDDADLDRQISFIHGSLYSRVAVEASRSALSENESWHIDEVAPLTQAELLQQAVAIATELRKQAIRAVEGGTTWITLEYIVKADQFQFQPMGYSLYSGVCGVALFLAALEHVTGGADVRDLALAAVVPVQTWLRQRKTQGGTAGEIGIGGAGGCGSISYALTRIGQLLNEPALLDDAQTAASLITQACISADQSLDIVSGAAGAILGLLACYDLSALPAIREQAIACGEHLLKRRLASAAGYRTWPSTHGKLLTGFSHGAAGIAYALLRLYAATHESAFLEAAREAIAFERSVFSPEERNWPDFRSSTDGAPSFTSGWCNGATGIGLARLGGMPVLETDDIRQDIEAALDTTSRYGGWGVDHLCCGIAGRVELLLLAATHLERPQLLLTAQQQAAWMVARARRTGAFYLYQNLPKGVYSPGFFQGTTGIGYELLRLAYPERLPSALLWA